MDVKIIENVAKTLYADKHYEYNDMIEERSDAISWMCEIENQKRLEDLGISDDELAVLKFVKQIIVYKWLNHKNRYIKHYCKIPVTKEDRTVEWWVVKNDAYSVNDTDMLKFNHKDEVRYMLDNLSESETMLLVDLLSDRTYYELADSYGIDYNALKMRVSRLKRKCKQLFNEALNKLF